MEANNLEVRPFAPPSEYEAMIDHFLLADDAFLRGMGVDRKRLPSREAWLDQVLADHKSADDRKDRLYLAWIRDGEQAGHSSVNKIKLGEEAYFHLHLWRAELRKAGLGTQLCRMSVEFYIKRLRLKRIYCEPFAGNPGPNIVLPKIGFRFIRRYRTVPGTINCEQEVNRYELSSTGGV